MTVYYKSLVLECGGKVYEPAEDSFLLADNLLVCRGDRVLDVGAGCGIIALAAAATASFVLGVDVNRDAVRQAKSNAKANDISNAYFAVSDLFSAVCARFDLIVFNPPYLPVCEEGSLARSWSGGAGGLEVVNRFIRQAGDFLAEGGRVQLLVSSINNIREVAGEFNRAGFSHAVSASKKLFFEELVVFSAEKRI